jgi:tRNA (guanosine-2'-O-)-methyltransferase
MQRHYPDEAWQYLSPQLSDARREKLLKASASRTRFVRLVIQDVHQPHNISACVRSAEAFGIQNIDVVNLNTKFSLSTVARGVDKWVHINQHASIEACAKSLHDQGYVIAAAWPQANAVPLNDLPLDRPIAVVFGNEHLGLAAPWREHADISFTIPMYGLVESLNISVSAAITLHELTQRARQSLASERYFLSQIERQALLNEWVCGQFDSWKLQLERLRK